MHTHIHTHAHQVLDPSVMYAHGPAFAGRPVLFREAPFLRNPRSPSWIRHAATVISSGSPVDCGGGGSGSGVSSLGEQQPPCAQVLQSKPPPGVNQQVDLFVIVCGLCVVGSGVWSAL